jgi:hypothetical protein
MLIFFSENVVDTFITWWQDVILMWPSPTNIVVVKPEF